MCICPAPQPPYSTIRCFPSTFHLPSVCRKKLTLGRCPQSEAALASQSTICRLENAPRKTEAARLCTALIDQFRGISRRGRKHVVKTGKTRCSTAMQIPAHRGQSFRRIADSVPVIADSF
jgi:hypothetical protein